MNAPRDAFDLPLTGVQVVEASAGTGKTFTIATLYLRTILERGLQPEQIVVATFARDAAAELSSRLRERVHLAGRILAEADPEQPRAGDRAEASITRASIRQARERHGIPIGEQGRRARAADLAMDTAVIGTLHAFCARLLAEYGFETGRAGPIELLEDLAGVSAEIVGDFWRSLANDAEAAALLAQTWGSPRRLLAQACDPRWRGREPEAMAPDLDAPESECARLRALIAAWDEPAFEAAEAELQGCFSHHGARMPRMKALRALQAWARARAGEDADASALRQASHFLSGPELDSKAFVRHSRGETFDLARRLCAALTDLRRVREAQAGLAAAEMLIGARRYYETELPRRLQALGKLGYDQVIDRTERALEGPARAQAVAKIRSRWPAALIDEFQDTDAQQWRVLRNLFAHEHGTLALVGDPKQAIYGFRGGDVHTYLSAREHASGAPLPLVESQRAGKDVCAAINALFARADAFVERRIEYAPVHAAPRVRDAALLIGGESAPALQLWRLPPSGKTRKDGSPCPWGKADARKAIEAACVAHIAGLLQGAQAGEVKLREGAGDARPLRAGDIAVLVNDNREAYSMQRALARAGVAASCRLRVSVYAGEEARDVLRVLESLRDPADAPRARAAQAGLLIGADAHEIALGTQEAPALDALLQRTADAAAQARRQGVLAFVHGLIADAAPRLLKLADGRRRVANYLQLAELAQAAWLQCFGLDDLCQQLARRIAQAGNADSDAEADAARLRLESDAQAVQIATVHAAKGLEYGVVLVPYAGLGKKPKPGGAPALTWYHDGDRPRVMVGRAVMDEAAIAAQRETLAEEARKFYVAVTRARAACVLPWGWINQGECSALHWLLHEGDGFAFDDAGCMQALDALRDAAPAAIALGGLPQSTWTRPTRADPQEFGLRAASMTRAIERDWRAWSFSRLVRQDAGGDQADPAPGSGDESPPAAAVVPAAMPVLAGARFGSAVHAALEKTDFAVWRDASGIPASEHALLVRSVRAQGLPQPGTMSLDRAVSQVGECVGAALNTPLLCGARCPPSLAPGERTPCPTPLLGEEVRLCDIAPSRRRAELEFHLRLAPARTREFFDLLHAHGYQTGRSGVGVARLHGLLSGVIDLVFEHGGRYHLIDYKTNLLPDYGADSLRAAIAAHDYDLQYLLYILALHRWLRQTLPDYGYDAHIGEVYYLFLRGLREHQGVHRDRPPCGLVEAMDALFDGERERAA